MSMDMDRKAGIGYALATWARFDDEIPDDLLKAVCGAFALVSAADGNVAESEIERFARVLVDSADRFPRLDPQKIDGLFRQLGQALLSDPEEGRRRVLLEVAGVADDERKRDLVRAAAFIAIEADGRTLESEQVVLREIAAALGF
jgi:tellurite resistance protein